MGARGPAGAGDDGLSIAIRFSAVFDDFLAAFQQQAQRVVGSADQAGRRISDALNVGARSGSGISSVIKSLNEALDAAEAKADGLGKSFQLTGAVSAAQNLAKAVDALQQSESRASKIAPAVSKGFAEQRNQAQALTQQLVSLVRIREELQRRAEFIRESKVTSGGFFANAGQIEQQAKALTPRINQARDAIRRFRNELLALRADSKQNEAIINVRQSNVSRLRALTVELAKMRIQQRLGIQSQKSLSRELDIYNEMIERGATLNASQRARLSELTDQWVRLGASIEGAFRRIRPDQLKLLVESLNTKAVANLRLEFERLQEQLRQGIQTYDAYQRQYNIVTELQRRGAALTEQERVAYEKLDQVFRQVGQDALRVQQGLQGGVLREELTRDQAAQVSALNNQLGVLLEKQRLKIDLDKTEAAILDSLLSKVRLGVSLNDAEVRTLDTLIARSKNATDAVKRLAEARSELASPARGGLALKAESDAQLDGLIAKYTTLIAKQRDFGLTTQDVGQKFDTLRQILQSVTDPSDIARFSALLKDVSVEKLRSEFEALDRDIQAGVDKAKALARQLDILKELRVRGVITPEERGREAGVQDAAELDRKARLNAEIQQLINARLRHQASVRDESRLLDLLIQKTQTETQFTDSERVALAQLIKTVDGASAAYERLGRAFVQTNDPRGSLKAQQIIAATARETEKLQQKLRALVQVQSEAGGAELAKSQKHVNELLRVANELRARGVALEQDLLNVIRSAEVQRQASTGNLSARGLIAAGFTTPESIAGELKAASAQRIAELRSEYEKLNAVVQKGVRTSVVYADTVANLREQQKLGVSLTRDQTRQLELYERELEKVNQVSLRWDRNIKSFILNAGRYFVVWRSLWFLLRQLRESIQLVGEADLATNRALRTSIANIGDLNEIEAKRAIIQRRLVAETARNTATAEQYGEALFQLTSAGIAFRESIEGVPAVLATAIGAQTGVTETAKALAGIYNVFGDTLVGVNGPQEKFNKIAAVVTQTMRTQQIELDELITGMRFAGSSARLLGLNFETVAAILGVLNTNILKGSRAGTAFGQMINGLVSKLDKLAKITGIQFDPKDPLDFLRVLRLLREQIHLIETSSGDAALSAEDLSDLFQLFNVRGIRAATVLIDKFDELEKQIEANVNAGSDLVNFFRLLVEQSPSKRLEIAAKAFRLMVAEFLAGIAASEGFASTVDFLINTFASFAESARVGGNRIGELITFMTRGAGAIVTYTLAASGVLKVFGVLWSLVKSLLAPIGKLIALLSRTDKSVGVVTARFGLAAVSISLFVGGILRGVKAFITFNAKLAQSLGLLKRLNIDRAKLLEDESVLQAERAVQLVQKIRSQILQISAEGKEPTITLDVPTLEEESGFIRRAGKALSEFVGRRTAIFGKEDRDTLLEVLRRAQEVNAEIQVVRDRLGEVTSITIGPKNLNDLDAAVQGLKESLDPAAQEAKRLKQELADNEAKERVKQIASELESLVDNLKKAGQAAQQALLPEGAADAAQAIVSVRERMEDLKDVVESIKELGGDLFDTEALNGLRDFIDATRGRAILDSAVKQVDTMIDSMELLGEETRLVFDEDSSIDALSKTFTETFDRLNSRVRNGIALLEEARDALENTPALDPAQQARAASEILRKERELYSKLGDFQRQYVDGIKGMLDKSKDEYEDYIEEIKDLEKDRLDTAREIDEILFELRNKQLGRRSPRKAAEQRFERFEEQFTISLSLEGEEKIEALAKLAQDISSDADDATSRAGRSQRKQLERSIALIEQIQTAIGAEQNKQRREEGRALAARKAQFDSLQASFASADNQLKQTETQLTSVAEKIIETNKTIASETKAAYSELLDVLKEVAAEFRSVLRNALATTADKERARRQAALGLNTERDIALRLGARSQDAVILSLNESIRELARALTGPPPSKTDILAAAQEAGTIDISKLIDAISRGDTESFIKEFNVTPEGVKSAKRNVVQSDVAALSANIDRISGLIKNALDGQIEAVQELRSLVEATGPNTAPEFSVFLEKLEQAVIEGTSANSAELTRLRTEARQTALAQTQSVDAAIEQAIDDIVKGNKDAGDGLGATIRGEIRAQTDVLASKIYEADQRLKEFLPEIALLGSQKSTSEGAVEGASVRALQEKRAEVAAERERVLVETRELGSTEEAKSDPEVQKRLVDLSRQLTRLSDELNVLENAIADASRGQQTIQSAESAPQAAHALKSKPGQAPTAPTVVVQPSVIVDAQPTALAATRRPAQEPVAQQAPPRMSDVERQRLEADRARLQAEQRRVFEQAASLKGGGDKDTLLRLSGQLATANKSLQDIETALSKAPPQPDQGLEVAAQGLFDAAAAFQAKALSATPAAQDELAELARQVLASMQDVERIKNAPVESESVRLTEKELRSVFAERIRTEERTRLESSEQVFEERRPKPDALGVLTGDIVRADDILTALGLANRERTVERLRSGEPVLDTEDLFETVQTTFKELSAATQEQILDARVRSRLAREFAQPDESGVATLERERSEIVRESQSIIQQTVELAQTSDVAAPERREEIERLTQRLAELVDILRGLDDAISVLRQQPVQPVARQTRTEAIIAPEVVVEPPQITAKAPSVVVQAPTQEPAQQQSPRPSDTETPSLIAERERIESEQQRVLVETRSIRESGVGQERLDALAAEFESLTNALNAVEQQLAEQAPVTIGPTPVVAQEQGEQQAQILGLEAEREQLQASLDTVVSEERRLRETYREQEPKTRAKLDALSDETNRLTRELERVRAEIEATRRQQAAAQTGAQPSQASTAVSQVSELERSRTEIVRERQAVANKIIEIIDSGDVATPEGLAESQQLRQEFNALTKELESLDSQIAEALRRDALAQPQSAQPQKQEAPAPRQEPAVFQPTRPTPTVVQQPAPVVQTPPIVAAQTTDTGALTAERKRVSDERDAAFTEARRIRESGEVDTDAGREALLKLSRDISRLTKELDALDKAIRAASAATDTGVKKWERELDMYRRRAEAGVEFNEKEKRRFEDLEALERQKEERAKARQDRLDNEAESAGKTRAERELDAYRRRIEQGAELNFNEQRRFETLEENERLRKSLPPKPPVSPEQRDALTTQESALIDRIGSVLQRTREIRESGGVDTEAGRAELLDLSRQFAALTEELARVRKQLAQTEVAQPEAQQPAIQQPASPQEPTAQPEPRPQPPTAQAPTIEAKVEQQKPVQPPAPSQQDIDALERKRVSVAAERQAAFKDVGEIRQSGRADTEEGKAEAARLAQSIEDLSRELAELDKQIRAAKEAQKQEHARSQEPSQAQAQAPSEEKPQTETQGPFAGLLSAIENGVASLVKGVGGGVEKATATLSADIVRAINEKSVEIVSRLDALKNVSVSVTDASTAASAATTEAVGRETADVRARTTGAQRAITAPEAATAAQIRETREGVEAGQADVTNAANSIVIELTALKESGAANSEEVEQALQILSKELTSTMSAYNESLIRAAQIIRQISESARRSRREAQGAGML